MTNRVLILGSGYIGNIIFDRIMAEQTHAQAGYKVVDRNTFNKYSDYDSVYNFLAMSGANIVINCIGKTGRPNIDWCEDNKEDTYEANTLVPMNIAKACRKLNIKFIHIGSGCIYSGTPEGECRLFNEKSKPNFIGSFYSKTKIIAEDLINAVNPCACILRIRMPVDYKPNNRNLISKLLKYTEIINDANSITYINDLVTIIDKLVIDFNSGTYNVVCDAALSPMYIRQFLFNNGIGSNNFVCISKHNLKVKAERSNCILDNSLIKETFPGVISNSFNVLDEIIKRGYYII